MTKVKTTLFALLLTLAAVIYVGRSGFTLPFPGDDHKLTLNATWKLTSPLASAHIHIELAVGTKSDSIDLFVDNSDAKVWNYYEDNYHGEYSWIRVLSRDAKVVSCGVNVSGAWVVTPMDKVWRAYCFFPPSGGGR